MSTLSEIEQAVRQLSSEELSAFRAWFAEFDAELWDRQFEADVAAGRLDALAEKALQHLREGRCTDLRNPERLRISGITIDSCRRIFKTLLISVTSC